MDIISKWDTGQGGVIETYICGALICGKLVASKDHSRLDTQNPDPNKRARTLIGSDILLGFKKTDSDTWEDGEIYNPDTGKSYSAKLTLDGDVLKVRGFKGIALLGKTVEWARVNP